MLLIVVRLQNEPPPQFFALVDKVVEQYTCAQVCTWSVFSTVFARGSSDAASDCQSTVLNALSRYGIVSLEIVLILAPSINLNPR